MRVLMKTQMTEGTPVRDYILKIFDHLNTLEILSGEIDAESQIDIILELLSDSFNQFNLYFNMNKIDFLLSEILNILQAAKDIIKGHPIVNIVEKKFTSKPFLKGKGK